MEIIGVDVRDEKARQEFYAIEQEVIRHDLPHGWERTYESFEQWALLPDNPHRRTIHLAATVEGTWVGTAEVGLSLQDNPHFAEVEVAVRPAARRDGVGRTLFERVEAICAENGRTTLCGEIHLRQGDDLADSAAGRFGSRFGFESVHQEDHLVLDLPASVDHLAGAVDVSPSGYDIVLWGEHCPDEYVEDFAMMRTQMANDVPIGEIDWEAVVIDTQRLRAGESRVAKGWIPIVAAARRRADGVMGGYSMLLLPRGGELVMQDDTLVMPQHRGHRLGTALKLATLGVVRSQYPQRTAIHTWTEPDNHAMQRTNADFGFTARERLHELQRKR
ncbi:MAG: GNAT family N-acetyltransferase [Nocardioides sp.]|nr:GNAT family N-acetyltransferase [Nocardioides sp.]